MKKQFAYLLAFVFALLIYSCGSKPTNSVEVKQLIQDNNGKMMSAFNSRDIETFTSYYLDEAHLLPPNSPIVKGKENIKQFWKGTMSVVGNLRLLTQKVEAINDIAYELGRYSLNINTSDSTNFNNEGKYVVIWKKQGDGNWKISDDIFNTDIQVNK